MKPIINKILLRRDFNRNDSFSKISSINQEIRNSISNQLKLHMNSNSGHYGSTTLPSITKFADNTLFDDEEEVIKEDHLDKSQDQSPKEGGIISKEYTIQLKDKIKVLRKYKKKKMIDQLKEKMRKINCKSVEEPYLTDESQIEYNGNKINKFEDILDSMDFSFKGYENIKDKETFEDMKQEFKSKLKNLNRNEVFEVLNSRKDRWNSNLGDKLLMIGMIDKIDTANK